MSTDDVYGSGLGSEDWTILRDVIWPFLHVDNPANVAIPQELPEQVKEHPIVRLVRKYQQTGEDRFLDQAGQHLIPTGEAFGWYVPLTK